MEEWKYWKHRSLKQFQTKNSDKFSSNCFPPMNPKGLFTYYVIQKCGGPDPPSPLVSQKSEIGLPRIPSLSEKIRNWLTPPPPSLSEIIFCHTPINLMKYTFQEESLPYDLQDQINLLTFLPTHSDIRQLLIR